MSSNTFQPGYTYRTINGELMKLESIGDGLFAGRSQGDPLKVDRWQIIYNRDGVPTDSTKASWILLPGTVDPREIHDKPEFRAETDSCIWRFGIAAALQDQADRMKELEAELRAAKTTGKDQYLETSRQMRVIRGRLGEIESKDKVGEVCNPIISDAWQKRLSNLETAVTGVNGFQASLKALRDALHGTDHEGENVKRSYNARLDELKKGLVLEHAERARGGTISYEGMVVAGMPMRPVDSAAWTGRRKTPKRTIKGGWINVFSGRQLSGIFSNQYDAINNGKHHVKIGDMGMGAPIACIHIPDFTEGEGL